MTNSNVKIFRTTKSIANPVGDGRHNRAEWQTALKKTHIPAGFVFALNEDGSVEDRSRSVEEDRMKNRQLREALMAVAGPELGGEIQDNVTIETVIAATPGGADQAVAALMNHFGLTASEFHSLLKAQAQPGGLSASAGGPASASASNPSRKLPSVRIRPASGRLEASTQSPRTT